MWSGYTCFAAIAYTVPDDIADVGYKVYLGRRKYFVSVDVGGGRIQWCVSPRRAQFGAQFGAQCSDARVCRPRSQVCVPQRAAGLAQGEAREGRGRARVLAAGVRGMVARGLPTDR